MVTLTVFTPTYNRADTLPRTYASLAAQTSRDFTWLVVDDGSTDGTRDLVAGWMATADFGVEYVYQDNAGKHSAHNEAVTRARTELLAILDADDELLPHAVATINAEWARMSADERQRIAGIWTLSRTPDGAPCGDPLPADVIDTTLQAMRFQYHCTGERLPCFKTAVLKQHLFPRTAPGMCSFIPEVYVWSAITRRHPIRFLNVTCRVYHAGDGLMAMARNEYRMSRCIVYGYAAPLANELDWFWHDPRLFFFSAAQTVRYALHGGEVGTMIASLSWRARVLMLAASPLAILLLARDCASGRIASSLREQPGVPPDKTRSNPPHRRTA